MYKLKSHSCWASRQDFFLLVGQVKVRVQLCDYKFHYPGAFGHNFFCMLNMQFYYMASSVGRQDESYSVL